MHTCVSTHNEDSIGGIVLSLPSLEMGQALLLSSFFHGARQALAVSFFGPDSPGVEGPHVPCALLYVGAGH